MAKIVLSASERAELENTKAELEELQVQIDAAVDGGLSPESMAVAGRDQLKQVKVLLDTFK